MTDHMERRSRWIPVALFGGLGAIIAADLMFAAVAVSSNPGLVTVNPFEKGLAHNRVLEEAERQRALGWAVDASVRADAVELRLTDAAGRPLEGVEAIGRLARPVGVADERALDFAADGDGLYRAPIAEIGVGQWELAVLVERGGERFQIVKKVQVR